MFIVKKCITPFLVPPGSLILILVLAAFWLWRRGQRRCASFAIVTALALWTAALAPVSGALMGGLESGLAIPSAVQGDVVVLLGGGIHEGVPDLTGRGAPAEDMLARVVTAVRVHRRLRIPIIISGGSVYAGRAPEAEVVRRFLVDLGVEENQILLESRSRDTRENAAYCRDIITRQGFRRPLLVTSAYHMRRAVMAFHQAGVAVTPLPAQFTTGGGLPYLWADYLPSAGALAGSATAVKEYLGLLFYRLTR